MLPVPVRACAVDDGDVARAAGAGACAGAWLAAGAGVGVDGVEEGCEGFPDGGGLVGFCGCGFGGGVVVVVFVVEEFLEAGSDVWGAVFAAGDADWF